MPKGPKGERRPPRRRDRRPLPLRRRALPSERSGHRTRPTLNKVAAASGSMKITADLLIFRTNR